MMKLYEKWRHYLYSFAMVLTALFLGLLVLAWIGVVATPFFYAAVALSAWLGGLWPGLFATLLASLSLSFFLSPPAHSFAMEFLDSLRLVVFLLVAGLMSYLHDRAQAAQKSSAFLASCSKSLSRTLDLQSTIHAVVSLPIGFICDFCHVEIIGPGGGSAKSETLLPPEDHEALNQYHDRYPESVAINDIRETIQTRKSRTINVSGRPLPGEPPGNRFLREAGVRSYTVVPLLAGERCSGAIALFRTRMIVSSGGSDMELVEEFASRAALAIEHALLYNQANQARQQMELLLKETHHRTKNNLQLVTSLLSLQEKEAAGECRQLLKKSQNMIRSIGRIHEVLYQSDHLDRVDFQAYLSEVANAAWSTYLVDEKKVDLKLDIENVELDTTSALLCGVIVNEAVTNSMKHAFTGNQNGKDHWIRVAASSMNHRLVLHISDNGKGCPGGNSSQDRSFGMKLIFLLAEQLDAKIEMMRQQGTHYRIEFSPSALID